MIRSNIVLFILSLILIVNSVGNLDPDNAGGSTVMDVEPLKDISSLHHSKLVTPNRVTYLKFCHVRQESGRD